jgi:hypothetical protein
MAQASVERHIKVAARHDIGFILPPLYLFSIIASSRTNRALAAVLPATYLR